MKTMTNPNPKERARSVQQMFGRIAPRYDLMNRIMTAGMDVRLRKIVIRKTHLPPHGSLLDLATGTGDLAREATRQFPDCTVIAADFTLAMMQTGQKLHRGKLNFVTADALEIPFENHSFDAVVSGFLLRNIVDIDQGLQEQFRILKPGAIFVSLDTTRPGKSILRPLIDFYTHHIIPLIGRILTGDREAYRYLPSTTDHFLSAEELVDRLAANGFKSIGFKRYMFSTVAIHWANKPS